MGTEFCERCKFRLEPSKDGTRRAQGHAPGCFLANRVQAFHPIVEKTTPKKKHTPEAQRQEALAAIDEFTRWLRLGGKAPPRMSLSPRRAVEILHGDGMYELLGKNKWEQYHRAAQVLGS